MTISRNEQVLAILQSTELELATKYGMADPTEINWTISKLDVKTYIEENGFPSSWVHFQEETFDGVYLLPTGKDWKVSYQERGITHYEEIFSSKSQALDYLLDEYFLKRKKIA